MVQEALEHLERTASELTQGASDGASQPVDGGASQPVVCALLGDSNLHHFTAEEAVQSLQPLEARWDTVWHVHSTTVGLVGDVAFVKGANCSLVELPVGFSHINRGVRNDKRDAFYLDLAVRIPAARTAQKRVRLA